MTSEEASITLFLIAITISFFGIIFIATTRVPDVPPASQMVGPALILQGEATSTK